MREIEIVNSIDIAAPKEVVWSYLVDWENLGRWMKEGSGFKVTSPNSSGPGVEAEAEIRIAGLKTVDAIRVTRWEPPSVLEIEHLGWVKGTGLMRNYDQPAGTHLYWREILIPPFGFPGAIGIRLFKPMMRSAFRRDLGLLKQLVEREYER